MRRGDLVPIVIVVGLAAFIGTQAARAPRRPRPADPVRIEAEIVSRSESPPAASGVRTLAATAPHDVDAEVRVSAAPAPSVDLADVHRRLRLGERGTYVQAMLEQLDSMLYRWPERMAEPIRVWIDPRPPLAGWSTENPSIVRAAFREWEQTGIPVRFSFVVNAGDADVTVTWVDRFESDRIGHTRWIHDQHRWMVSGSQIVLALNHPTAGPIPATMLSGVARHEIGHLLGISHSPNESDIMYPKLFQPALSAADRATVRLLYSVPAGSVKGG